NRYKTILVHTLGTLGPTMSSDALPVNSLAVSCLISLFFSPRNLLIRSDTLSYLTEHSPLISLLILLTDLKPQLESNRDRLAAVNSFLAVVGDVQVGRIIM